MDVNNMVAALAAKTVDAMVNVEPYNVIAVDQGIGTDLMDFSAVDPMPVFMAATPDFVAQKPDTVVAYLKAWLDVAEDFKNNPKKVADVIYAFYTDKGYTMSLDIFAKALARVEVDPGFPGDLKPYMQEQAEILLARESSHPGLEQGAASGLESQRRNDVPDFSFRGTAGRGAGLKGVDMIVRRPVRAQKTIPTGDC